MLEEMSREQIIEWQAYSMLEPFQDVRSDYHTALLAKTAWDIAVDHKKHPKPIPLEDFILKWNPDKSATSDKGPEAPSGPAPTRKLSNEEMKQRLMIYANMYSAKPKVRGK